MELSCSFLHTKEEFDQLDLKWYRDMDEEPFLQWVPSSQRPPQVVGEENLLTRRMNMEHMTANTTMGYRIEQIIVMEGPTVELSGEYHCRVATFSEEIINSLIMTIFGKEELTNNLMMTMMFLDPGVGPVLKYSSLQDQVELSCCSENVFPKPSLDLEWTEGVDWGNQTWRLPG